MEYNEGNRRKTVNVKAIDVPGQGHFRQQVQERFNEVLGVLIVIDSTTRQTDAQAAELLYDILNSNVLQRNRVPTLVVCNKQDSPEARNASHLEKEVETQMYHFTLIVGSI
jgi:signal recognition particle receptor subunit beta